MRVLWEHCCAASCTSIIGRARLPVIFLLTYFLRQEADTAGLLMSFVKAVSAAYPMGMTPALRVKELVLARLQALRRLTVNATLVTESCFTAASAELRKMLFMPFYTIALAASSRIHVKLHCLYRYQGLAYSCVREILPPVAFAKVGLFVHFVSSAAAICFP